MIHKFLFFFKEAFSGMRHAYVMMIVTYFTIFISLIIFAGFLIVHLNLSNLSKFMMSKLEIRVFLNESLTKREINYFQGLLNDIPNVSQVDLINRDEAWKEFSNDYKSLDLDKLVDQNPLPHSFKVKLTDKNELIKAVKTIDSFSYYVDSTVYGGDLSSKLQKLSSFVLLFGWTLVTLLSIATLFIVVNTIKLTVINRSEEITIMKLVGASDSFIMAPFLIEGLLLGVLSSFSAIAVLVSVNTFLLKNLASHMPFIPFNLSLDKLWLIYIIVIFWATLLTSVAAVISTKSALKRSI